VYCLCLSVYCHRVSTQLQLTNISISISINSLIHRVSFYRIHLSGVFISIPLRHIIIIRCSVVLLYCCTMCNCYVCCISDVAQVILTCMFLCRRTMYLYIADCFSRPLGCFDPSNGLLNENKTPVSNSNTQHKSTTTRDNQPHAAGKTLSTNQQVPTIINHIRLATHSVQINQYQKLSTT
jgi:hypothetical protein